MVNPVTFPRVSGTTATYLHPVLQATLLQQARTQEFAVPAAAPAKEPTIPAVTAVDRTAAYSAGLARDAATAVLAANATVRYAKGTAKVPEPPAGPAADLARDIVLERASTQVGVLLDRAAAERRVAVRSGVPASRLAEINSSTSRLYHALDVLA